MGTFGGVTPVLLICGLCVVFTSGHMVGSNPYRHREVMDDKGNYKLEWEYKPGSKELIFNVTVKCEGYVGLGLAKRQSMMNADFVIAGVTRDGLPYVKDMHTKGNRTLLMDKSQDWKLTKATQENGVTCLTMSRAVKTCDEDDLEITEGRTVILWAYGENDTLGYHYHNRGFKDAYLLDPNLAPELKMDKQTKMSYRAENPKGRVWPLRRTSTLKQQPTSYFCSIHRGPQINRKNHIIGYNVHLGNEDARRHTHHFVVYKCNAPDGVDAKSIFEPLVNYEGEECHFSENRKIPVNFCREMIFVWGVGGEPLFLKDDVGISMDVSDGYIMFETHFDNRDLRQAEFEVGVDFYLTSKLRPRDGNMMTIGYSVDGATTAFPPGSIDFDFIGQCDPTCTTNLPKQGVKMSAVFLHSHDSGTMLSLRHYRNGKEIRPVLTDDNYNPNYQQYRNLKQDVTILPGDHLGMECVIDNSRYNGTTVGGFGTHQTMCIAFTVIDTEITRDYCTSEYPAYRLLNQLGVDNITWDVYLQDRIVSSPANLRGLTLGQVGDRLKWTSKSRKYLEEDMLYAAHFAKCPDITVPSAEDILRQAQQLLQAQAPSGGSGGQSQGQSQRSQSRTRGRVPTPAIKYSGIGFTRTENDLELQKQVERAVETQIKYGSRALQNRNDEGAIILRAGTGNPNLFQRFPANGVSDSGMEPRARLPRSKGWTKPEDNKCKKEAEKKKNEELLPFLHFTDLQYKSNVDAYYGALPILF